MGLTVTQLLRLRRFESCSPHILYQRKSCMTKGFFLSLHSVTNNFGNRIAEVAQLVERQPSKLNVAGSTPVFRSKKIILHGVIFLLNADLAQRQSASLVRKRSRVQVPQLALSIVPKFFGIFFCLKFKPVHFYKNLFFGDMLQLILEQY